MPCCLCEDPETVARLDLPARAIPAMKHGEVIAWRDVIGDVSIHFCEDDWEFVSAFVLDLGGNPLDRCNAAHASFSIREDFESYLNETRAEQNHLEYERERLADCESTIRESTDGDVPRRELIEAKLTERVLADTPTPDAD